MYVYVPVIPPLPAAPAVATGAAPCAAPAEVVSSQLPPTAPGAPSRESGPWFEATPALEAPATKVTRTLAASRSPGRLKRRCRRPEVPRRWPDFRSVMVAFTRAYEYASRSGGIHRPAGPPA